MWGMGESKEVYPDVGFKVQGSPRPDHRPLARTTMHGHLLFPLIVRYETWIVRPPSTTKTRRATKNELSCWQPLILQACRTCTAHVVYLAFGAAAAFFYVHPETEIPCGALGGFSRLLLGCFNTFEFFFPAYTRSTHGKSYLS